MTSGPVRERDAMVAGMSPVLKQARYRFVSHGPDDDFIDLLHRMFAMVREDEGVTLVIRARDTDPGPHFACITLEVHSDLEGVGLTAAVASVLADAQIACNVIAGYHHDHLFVPWDAREEALIVLKRLSQDAGR